LSLAPSVRAAGPEDCLQRYDAGDYPGAAQCLTELMAQGHHNGHLWYDLGCAWLRAGETGRAVHAFRSASLYLPRDGDVEANLAAARKLVQDDLPPPSARGPVLSAILAPFDVLSEGELRLLGLGLGAVGWGLLVLRLRLVSGPISAAGVTGAVLGLALQGAAWERGAALVDHPVAVVLDEEVTLRSGRDVRSVDLARLHEGAEVLRLGEDTGWAQVRLADGKRGWLPASSLLVVLP
jgi:hypothetical protein